MLPRYRLTRTVRLVLTVSTWGEVLRAVRLALKEGRAATGGREAQECQIMVWVEEEATV